MNKIRKLKERNKAQSDMVSYVLLIVIAMGISVGIYSWLKFYAPSANQGQSCPADVAIAINDYNCSDQIIWLTIENKGFFTVDGFFARGTNDSSKSPTTMLPTLDAWADLTKQTGRYDFKEKFIHGQIKVTTFDYESIGSIQRIQIQPFVIADKGQLLICKNVADITLDGC